MVKEPQYRTGSTAVQVLLLAMDCISKEIYLVQLHSGKVNQPSLNFRYDETGISYPARYSDILTCNDDIIHKNELSSWFL
jgi:hypothetical protein